MLISAVRNLRRHPFSQLWVVFACFLLALMTFAHALFRSMTWERAEAVVVAVEDPARGRGYSHAPRLRFETPVGGDVTVLSRERCGPGDYHVGDRVELLYPAAEPEEAVVPTWWRLYGLSALCLSAGLLMSVATLLAWASARCGKGGE